MYLDKYLRERTKNGLRRIRLGKIAKIFVFVILLIPAFFLPRQGRSASLGGTPQPTTPEANLVIRYCSQNFRPQLDTIMQDRSLFYVPISNSVLQLVIPSASDQLEIACRGVLSGLILDSLGNPNYTSTALQDFGTFSRRALATLTTPLACPNAAEVNCINSYANSRLVNSIDAAFSSLIRPFLTELLVLSGPRLSVTQIQTELSFVTRRANEFQNSAAIIFQTDRNLRCTLSGVITSGLMSPAASVSSQWTKALRGTLSEVAISLMPASQAMNDLTELNKSLTDSYPCIPNATMALSNFNNILFPSLLGFVSDMNQYFPGGPGSFNDTSGMGGITFTPSTLNFGNLSVGDTSGTKTITVINYLNYPVNIAAIAAVGDFQQTNTCGGSIPANSTCVLSVTFNPQLTGSIHGDIFFEYYMGPTVLVMTIPLARIGS